jgi:hypothetical protein
VIRTTNKMFAPYCFMQVYHPPFGLLLSTWRHTFSTSFPLKPCLSPLHTSLFLAYSHPMST